MPPSNSPPPGRTRIQKKNRKLILDAALEIFSKYGFRGATLDQIALAAALSKPNLLYYFPSKEAIHAELLSCLMDTWLDPLRALGPSDDPRGELLDYMRRKLDMSRRFPRESRLFANEILQGAPRMHDAIAGDLKTLVDRKSILIQAWMDAGKIAPANPRHLLFSIWALTQHYADFEAQVRLLLDKTEPDPFPEAERFLEQMYSKLLTL